MRTTYRITMSNGAKSDIEDSSAATAMVVALKQHPGHRVAKCHSGLTVSEAADLRQTGVRTAIAGWINHEIPDHVPFTEEEAAQKRVKKVDATMAMFDDKEIATESKMAREKFEHTAVVSKA